MVEGQQVVSTMKLVDTLEEQALLEELLDESKPPVPLECRGLHYLLSTPFRYGAVYPRGSRFRRAGLTPGVFYTSERLVTAVAEMVFHRLLFFAESPGTPFPPNAGEHTAFAVRYRTRAGLDLTGPPLVADMRRWSDPVDYGACQTLADAARAAGVEALRYQSVRDPRNYANIALLTCAAFTSRTPLERQTWRVHLDARGGRALCETPPLRLQFDRSAFVADPRLAAMHWER